MSASRISDALRGALPRGCLGLPVYHYESLESTMTEAARLAGAGASEGTMVLAETQTEGRGRLGRRWLSESAVGIYFTLVLRPRLTPASSPVLTLMAGLSVAAAAEPFVPGQVDLRWPNDLIVNGKKCAGILVEMRAEAQEVLYVLLGIGINVNQDEFPEGLDTPASSLQLEAGRPVPRMDFLISLLRQLDADYNFLLTHGAERTIQRFERVSSYARGKRVRVGEGGDAVIGTTHGLTSDGVLLIRRDDGTIERIVAGSVRPA